MNIDDVKPDDISLPKGSRFEAIFAKQRELMEKYDPLEKRNGAVVPDPPYDLDNNILQMRVKDFFWRTTEEIAEALDVDVSEVVLNHWRREWAENAEVRHLFEELSDALHFLTEASIYVNFTDEQVIDDRYLYWVDVLGEAKGSIGYEVREQCMDLIIQMGLAANCFKNKPWKNSHMPTDRTKFYDHLRSAWDSMLAIFARLGMTIDEVYVLYAQKHAVNQFRQRSNY